MAESELVNEVAQGYQTSLRQLKALLEGQSRLRAEAERLRAEERVALERVTEALCPGLVDGLRVEHPQGVSPVEARALSEAVIRDVRRRLNRLEVAEVAGRSVGELYERALAENGRLREENAQLAAQVAEAQGRAEQTELRLMVLQQALADAQRRLDDAGGSTGQSPTADGSPVAPEQLPQWIQDWQQTPTYDRDLVLLQVLAETGAPRRADAIRLAGERLSTDPASSGIARAFRRCAEQFNLVEEIETGSEIQGKPARLVRLTEKGRDACRLLLGREPAPSQTDELLERHHGPELALLVLEAAEVLRQAGYQVDLFPAPLELPDDPPGRSFVPSLMASHRERVVYVWVVRERPANPERYQHPLHTLYRANGGEIYIVVPNRQVLDDVRGDVLFWAVGRKLVLRMCNLADAAGKSGDDVWTFRRGEPPVETR